MNRVLIIEHDKCVGCRSCEMMCSLTHEGLCSPALSRIRVVKDERVGWNVPIGCSMCDKPYCVMACPVGAASKDLRTGLVGMADGKCIGCRQCVQACPFGHAGYNVVKGIAFKCDLCGGEPQCAKFCWTGAISFDYLDNVAEARRQATAQKVLGQ